MTRLIKKRAFNYIFVLLVSALSISECSNEPVQLEGYLFAYFTGNGPGQETVRFAISKDGYYADPDVLYSEKTGKYYIYPTSDGFDS